MLLNVRFRAFLVCMGKLEADSYQMAKDLNRMSFTTTHKKNMVSHKALLDSVKVVFRGVKLILTCAFIGFVRGYKEQGIKTCSISTITRSLLFEFLRR